MNLKYLTVDLYKGLITLLFVVVSHQSFAQPMSGTFTVGPGGQYPTLNAAVTDVTTRGVNAPVVFRLRTGTFMEQVIIGAIGGSSATNTITFEAESGNAQDAVVSFAPTNSDNYVIQLNNASFITLRNFTIETSGASYNRAIHGINNLNSITFEGLRINLPITTSASEDKGAVIIRPGSSISSNVRFINNIITGGSYGILHVGNSNVVAYSPGAVFTGNTITSVHARPVYFQYQQGLIFNNNIITHPGAAYSDYYGAGLDNISGYVEMTRNRITGVAGHALRISYWSGIEAQPSVIANNFFHSNSNYGTVYLNSGLNHIRFYHNSVHNSSSGEAFYFNRWQSTGTRIVNNIFKAGSGYAVEFQTSSTVNSILESDHNNLFTSGSFIARDGSTNYGTLSSWQTASGFEANTVSYDPQFASNADLSASAPGIASAGKNLLAVVAVDINGVSRTVAPSLGATQFSASALTPLSGVYTIGTGAFNYPSINAAIDAMKVNGINGPVIFRLNAQTFAERFVLPAISGMSAANPIIFESQSGNPADVILTPAAATDAATNYIARLSNAAYVTFRNITFEPGTGTAFNRAIHIENRADNLTFENLRINLPVTTSVTEDRSAIAARPTLSSNLRFINNVVTGGSHGIFHIGNSSSYSPGTVFTGNTITSVHARPVYFQYQQGAIFNNNTITHPGAAYSDYYGAGLDNISGYVEMTHNRITGAVGHAIRVSVWSGIESQPSIIANNFFQSNSNYGTVHIYYGLSHAQFYHNSVHNSANGEAFYFNRWQSTGTRIVNNIFKAGSGHAVELQTSSTVNSILESDHNNLFTSGSFIARDGSTNYGTLALWQTASGFEGNSVSFDPQFASNSDLSASAPGIASAGKNLLSVVAVDINGVSRTATPSLGAMQFSASALTPLSGVYTIGTGAFDFTSINAAIDDMKANGINGPVTFRLNSQTFAERFVLPAISGMSSANPIIFESQSGNPADVILTPAAATDAANNYIARLSNAAYVTFRNITFQPATGTGFNRAIQIENRADDLAFENLRINLPVTTSVTEDRSAIAARPTLSSNLRFINNVVTGGSHGIFHIGNSSSYSPGTVFMGNTISSVHARPVYFQYQQGVIFNNNIITHPGAAYSDYYGAGLDNISGYVEMTHNRITGAVGHALRVSIWSGIESQPSIVANNLFHSNSNYGTVHIYYGLSHVQFYHNSVHNSASGEAFYFNRWQSTGTRIVNNIFKAGSGYAIDFQTSSTVNSILESNYNNLFTSGSFIARDGSTNYGTLSSWQTASGFEGNSVSYDPQFASNADLSASAPGIASAGKNLLSVVAVDINGVSRTATPSLGATQFSASALTPLSGVYTIGTGAFNYTSINAAIDAMKVNGINGPVTFRLNAQTFAERFVLPAISGMSSANPIIFESQSGNPADVTLTPTAATDGANNYIARLSNATNVTFRNITFQPATGTGFNRAIHVENRADDLAFENLRINLPVTTSVTEDRSAITARATLSSNLRFVNNIITGGAYGILYIGNSNSYSPGTVFTGNTITSVHARPVYFQYLQGIIFNNNTITHPGAAYSDYYGAGLDNISGYVQMMRNRITGVVGHALRLSIWSGIEAQPSIVANNFFHSNSSYGTVYIYYGLNHVQFYHNSVHNSSGGEAFYFNRWQSTGNRIVNNIFKAGTGYAIEFQTSSTANSVLESNNNNLFTSGSFLGRDGSTNYGTLSAWQGASGFEANSVSIDPQFQSNTELKTSVGALSAAGKNLNAVVPDDIDGIARPSTPSLGATQFGASGSPLSGTYTINTSGSGATNFTSFTLALDALKNFGINGPVVFKVSGEFNEQLTFLSVAGSSATNTVTFESASGNVADAMIRFSSTSSGANFTVQLSNADHHRFRNLTIRADNAVYSRAVYAINRTNDIRFEGNSIESVVTTATTSDRAGIVIASAQAQDVQLLNNTVRNGSYGIQFTGPSSKATGTIIRGNIIDKAYYRGIDLTYHTGFILDHNQVLNNPSATNFKGMEISSVDGAFQITANKVTGGNGTALSLTSALASAGSPALLANNFFQTNNGSGYETVYLNYLRNVNIYHNAINATGSGTGFYYVSSSGQNIRIVNNIVKAVGVSVNIADPVAVSQIDYNDYHTTGATLGNWGVSGASDLAAWQAQTGQDVNSLSVDPQYQSTADLHALASSLAGAGLDVTTDVPTDINGSPRTLPVSIGASQFSAAFSLDGTISKLIAPVSSCSLTDAASVTIEITNLGASAISGFQVAYRLNTGTPVVESVPGAVVIAPGAKHQYTFTQKINLSAKQTFNVEASIILAGDEQTANDNLVSTLTHYPDLITTITNNTTICSGEAVALIATGGVQYAWNTGANSAGITVSPTATTTYTVQITNANNCQETREVTVTVRETSVVSFTGTIGYTASYVSPLQGASNEEFDFRMIYTDANGNLPASGYPRVELDANGNGQSTDPLDIITVMQEADPADTDVSDGKEYRASITDLADNIAWRSRIVALNSNGCRTQTSYVSSPVVSDDLLDVGIYANDISFSKANPAINEPIKIYARVRNTSDYLAANFVVRAYIEDVLVFSQTIVQLNPQSSTTVQWDQSFPTAGFYPVKIVIDETDVLDEDNELNNFAIRPILTGDYELPGGINCNAIAAPLTLQPGQGITVTGTAQYFGIDPSVNPNVAGATVIARITGGAQAQSTTGPDGGYSLTLPAPIKPGAYVLNIEVTDYTLTGRQGPMSLTVLPAPPAPDLSTFISLDRNTIVIGEQISGSVILQNTGDVIATNFLFRYFNCGAVLGEEQVASLAPGESRTYTFTTTSTAVGDCFNRNNCQFRAVADVNNTVAEKTEANNQSTAYLTVLPDKPDLTPLNTTNSIIPGDVNMLNPFTFSVRVDNIGGINATTHFAVNVYMDAMLIRSENILQLNSCDGHTFVVTHDFGGDTGDKLITIKVDEPVGSGVVAEYRETNNEFSKVIRHLPPPAQYANLNVGNGDMSVTPVLPAPGSPFSVDVIYRNNGQLAISTPFNIEMTVMEEDGSQDIETLIINEVILPGATRTITLNTSLATDGDHALKVRLDSGNGLTESSEGDNVIQMPLCIDLSVSPVGNVWGSFYVNTLQHLTALVSNHGLFTASDVSVSFYLDNVRIASTILPTVEPTTRVGSYAVSIPHLFGQTGTFELKVVVDDPATYTECRENNNEYKGNINVRVPAADVRVFSEYIAPGKINPDVNEPVSIFLSYDNTGIGDSGPFKARILVDDVPLGFDVDVPSVAAGDDGTVEIPTPYRSSTAGIRVIRAVLDPENVLTETSRLNNEATRTLVVGKAPNLLFTDLQPDVVCPADGSNVIITATVYNDGDIQATAEVLFYYIADADTIPFETKTFTLAGKESVNIETEWLVINKTYNLYAEIRNSDPVEYDESDNTIVTGFCSGPYFNLFARAEGQGIIKKTPDKSRYEGVQPVTISAVPARGWVFARWQGDASGNVNPLTVNLTSDQTVVAVFDEPLVAPTVTDATRCGPGAVDLQASGAVGAQTYAWYTVPTGGTSIHNGNAFTTPELSATTPYYVALSSFNNEGARAEVRAVISSLPPQPAIVVDGPLNCPDENKPTVLKAPAGYPGYLWSGGETTQSIDVVVAGVYTVQVLDHNACASAASTEVVVTDEACDQLIVYDAISPGNGDDLNNHLVIRNIDKLPETRENKLKIYNRWGDLVFEAINYDNMNNTFVGQANSGKELPGGTYYYVLEFTSGRKDVSGYITLRR